MNKTYWDQVAGDYEREVLSVWDHDTAGLLRSRIRAAGAAHPGSRAADLGCGVGKFTPILAESFAQVHACDQSARGLAAAREHCRDRANVAWACFDLASEPAPFAPVEFVLCVNVLIVPSLDERMRLWRAVTNQVAHGGTLLLVVPSLESVLFGYFAEIDEHLQAGCSCKESLHEFAPVSVGFSDVRQGVHALDGLPTKHYLREELEVMLPAHECDVTEIVKLEYAERPFPSWDWLVTAVRR